MTSCFQDTRLLKIRNFGNVPNDSDFRLTLKSQQSKDARDRERHEQRIPCAWCFLIVMSRERYSILGTLAQVKNLSHGWASDVRRWRILFIAADILDIRQLFLSIFTNTTKLTNHALKNLRKTDFFFRRPSSGVVTATPPGRRGARASRSPAITTPEEGQCRPKLRKSSNTQSQLR